MDSGVEGGTGVVGRGCNGGDLLPAALGNMLWLLGIKHCQMPMETGMRCNGM